MTMEFWLIYSAIFCFLSQIAWSLNRIARELEYANQLAEGRDEEDVAS